MFIYVVTCLLSLSIAYCTRKVYYKCRPVPQNVVAILSALPLIFVTGLRYGIGSDYFAYKYWFETGNLGKYERDPLFFFVLNPVIQYFGGDFYTSIFVISSIFFVLIFLCIFKDSPYPLLSIYLLFGMTYFFVFMNAMRQFLSLGILLYAMKYLEEDNIKWFFVLFFIAVGIHHASIIFVIVYFIYKLDINIKFILIFTPLLFFAIYFSKDFLSYLTVLLNYDRYTGDTTASGIIVTIEFFWQLVLIVAAGVLPYKKTSYINTKKFRLYFNTQLMNFLVFAIIPLVNSNELNRILWIFGFSSIIFTPMVIKRIPSQVLRLLTIGIVVVGWGGYMYLTIISAHAHEVIPYQSVFDVLL